MRIKSCWRLLNRSDVENRNSNAHHHMTRCSDSLFAWKLDDKAREEFSGNILTELGSIQYSDWIFCTLYSLFVDCRILMVAPVQVDTAGISQKQSQNDDKYFDWFASAIHEISIKDNRLMPCGQSMLNDCWRRAERIEGFPVSIVCSVGFRLQPSVFNYVNSNYPITTDKEN